MIEILARDGLAREMRWTAGGRHLTTPSILFLSSGKIAHFGRGEAFLSAGDPVEEKFTLITGGSWFVPAPPGPDSGNTIPRIPPFPGIPAGLEAAPGEAFAAALEGFRAAPSGILPVTGVYPPDLGNTGAELFLFAGAVENSFRPRRFAEEMMRLRQAAGYGRLVYAPGLGEPAHLALLAYCGIDLFDSSPLLAAARRGTRLFPAWRTGSSEKGVCHCPACEREGTGDERTGPGAGGPGPGTTKSTNIPTSRPADLPGPDHDVQLLYEHNCYSALSEIHIIRSAIRSGRLRELVENRLSDAWLVAALRHLDLRHFERTERYFPVARPASGGMAALGRASLTRPEVERFRRRVLERYRRPHSSPVLLLLPCSARKPYSSSLSHRIFRSWLEGCGNPGAVHEVVVTSPLGIVPMELESFYPAGSYDVPVTGDWDEQEIRIVREQLRQFVSSGRYGAVICHLSGMDFLREALPDSAAFTGGERAASRPSLEAMLRALRESTAGLPKVRRREAEREGAAAMCRFQFGEGGEALADRIELRRRGPDLRLLDDNGVQVGMLQHERGLLSLTMDGGRRLAGRTDYEVEIGDFHPTGTVFSPGVVKAAMEIRPGDEVLVTHGGELRGVGVAVMSAAEMEESEKGAAVRLRHHLSSRSAEQ